MFTEPPAPDAAAGECPIWCPTGRASARAVQRKALPNIDIVAARFGKRGAARGIARSTGGSSQALDDLGELGRLYARIEVALHAQILAFGAYRSGNARERVAPDHRRDQRRGSGGLCARGVLRDLVTVPRIPVKRADFCFADDSSCSTTGSICCSDGFPGSVGGFLCSIDGSIWSVDGLVCSADGFFAPSMVFFARSMVLFTLSMREIGGLRQLPAFTW
jgi:hypothetical protein